MFSPDQNESTNGSLPTRLTNEALSHLDPRLLPPLLTALALTGCAPDPFATAEPTATPIPQSLPSFNSPDISSSSQFDLLNDPNVLVPIGISSLAVLSLVSVVIFFRHHPEKQQRRRERHHRQSYSNKNNLS